MPNPGRTRIKDKVIHKRIKTQINKPGTAFSPGRWMKRKNLRQLYKLAQNRNWFGYGGWYKYLKGYHKVSALTRRHMPDKRIHHYIKLQLKKVENLSSRYWMENTKPVSPAGQSLNA